MKNTFSIQSLLVVLFFIAALLALVFVLAGEALAGQGVLVVAAGVVVALALWGLLQRLGRPAPVAETPTTAPAPAAPRQPAKPQLPPESSALHLLSLLQRKGRLIDFLQEDLSQFDDAQIGAAVRSVHEGCKAALDESVQLEPIFDEAEGHTVTVAPGFDAHAVRLLGNVAGDPPFKGALLHRGWRVVRVDLPEQLPSREQARIVAAAEVEVS